MPVCVEGLYLDFVEDTGLLSCMPINQSCFFVVLAFGLEHTLKRHEV